MGRRIIAVNAGPRAGWNTDTLITEASKGAESAGAGIERFDLFRLERYTGCISCFGCKKEKFKGNCVCRDGLTPVLLIMTSNAPDSMYMDKLRNYQQILDRFVGPAKVFVSGDTLQLKDYSKTDWPWSMFDPEAKKQRHETVFPEECRQAFLLGEALGRGEWS